MASVFKLDELIETETPTDGEMTASLEDGLLLQGSTPVQRATKRAKLQSAHQAAVGTPSHRIRRRIRLLGDEALINSVGLQPQDQLVAAYKTHLQEAEAEVPVAV